MLDIMDTVRPLKADVIAVTGDLVSRTADESAIQIGVVMLSELSKDAPVVYAFGNHETTLPQNMRRMLMQTLENTDVHMLNDASVNICGVDFYGYVLPNACYRNKDGSYRRLEKCTVSEMKAAVGECGESPSVLLAHNPMGFEAYAQWGADVVLSGHIHGGIVRLPLLGGVLSPERRFFPKYTKGCYRMANTTMVVSAGIGKLRFNNPSEIVCLDLLRDGEECLK